MMRRYLVLGMVVLGAAAGYGVTMTQSTLYASTSTLMVVPARVPDTLVQGTVGPIDTGKMARLQQMILSRTRLERIITDFALYRDESKTMTDEELVRLMRDRIVMEPEGDTVRVGFVHHEPRVAMRVAERLVSLMVEENLRDREMQAENTNQFMDSQMDEVRRRLDEKHVTLAEQRRQAAVPRSMELDLEVLEARYRELFKMSEEAKVAANMERRQIGEQFKIIDMARMPEQPMPRGRHKATAIGAAIGLLAGLGIAFRRPRG
jgi:uncharacterized protein involved in exopolysaccharide biosynthesis